MSKRIPIQTGRAIVAGLCVAFLLAGCGAEKSNGPDASASVKAEKTASLTAKKWKIASHTVAPAVTDLFDRQYTDVLARQSSCGKDDVLSYAADGKWSRDAGGSKCFGDTAQVATGTWALNASATELTSTDDAKKITLVYKLAEVGAATLVLTRAHDDWDDFEMHTATLTYSAQ